MIRKVVLIGVFGIFYLFVFPLYASSPMIKKHLFSPKPENNQVIKDVKQSLEATKLSKELKFTGIIMIKNERMVLVRDKKKKELKTIFRVGDKIRTITVDEIGANYVVLADKEKKIRMNLYSDKKDRPVTPSVHSTSPAVASSFAQNQAKNQLDVNVGTNAGNSKSGNAVSNDIINSIKKNLASKKLNQVNTKSKSVNGNGNNVPSNNSFLEMIKKSQKNIQENPEAYRNFKELLDKAKGR